MKCESDVFIVERLPALQDACYTLSNQGSFTVLAG